MTKDLGDWPPTQDAMSAFLHEVHQCASVQRQAMENALNHYAEAAPTDCRLALDEKSLSGHGRRTAARNLLYHRGWRLAHLMATNVGDHLQAVGDVAVDPPRVFAHMTLARAALEGAARVSYLLPSTGTLPDRVLRATALLVASAEEALTATADLSGHPALRETAVAAAQRRKAEILRLVARADILVIPGKRGRRIQGVSWRHSPDEVTNCHPNVTALLKKLAPSKPAAYRIGSGAVHSQPWVLDEYADLDSVGRRPPVWKFHPTTLAGSVDLAVTASVLTIEAFAAMLGQDASLERAQARRRERRVTDFALAVDGI